jgi:putative hemolysin
MISVKKVLEVSVKSGNVNLKELVTKPLFIPESA